MKAVVVGSGGWGTALSMVLCDNGHDVTLWSHDPAKAAEMTKTRENSKLKGVRHAVLRRAGDRKEDRPIPDTGDRSGQCFQGHRAGYEPPHEPDFDGSHREHL